MGILFRVVYHFSSLVVHAVGSTIWTNSEKVIPLGVVQTLPSYIGKFSASVTTLDR